MTSAFARIALLLMAAAALSATPAQALDPASVRPILRQVTDRNGLDLLDDSTEYTFGYFFDVNSDNAFANALGFSFQDGWATGGNSYQVSLWSYVLDPDNDDIGDYTLLASKDFTPGDPNLQLLDGNIPPTGLGNYYWLGLGSNLPLAKTGLDVDPDELTGYIVGATGIFGGAGANLPEVAGTPVFQPDLISYEYEGYNISGEESYPVPIFPFPAFKGQGFWNANVSVNVPGPLPLLGVGAAFGWSRRLKAKSRASN
jgi:hypothetical protein